MTLPPFLPSLPASGSPAFNRLNLKNVLSPETDTFGTRNVSGTSLTVRQRSCHESHRALPKAAEGFPPSPQRTAHYREMGGLSQESILCVKNTLRASLEDTVFLYHSWNNAGNLIKFVIAGDAKMFQQQQFLPFFSSYLKPLT